MCESLNIINLNSYLNHVLKSVNRKEINNLSMFYLKFYITPYFLVYHIVFSILFSQLTSTLDLLIAAPTHI